MQQPVIAFIGAGNMATSLIGGLVKGGYPADKIIASNPSSEKLTAVKSRFSINITNDNVQAIKDSEVVVLAVKPNHVPEVAKELAGSINKDQLVMSVAAGIQNTQIQQWLECQVPLIRCMPNTPALIGAGACGLFANEQATQMHRDFAESMMRSVGVTVWVDSEDKIDVVTALSGSGPAYFLLIFEAMLKAAVTLGLEEDQARLLILQTALGAARMAMESKDSVSYLREKITSPGGTTQAALNILQQHHIEDIFAQALTAGKQRATQMADVFSMGSNKAIEKKA